MNKPTFTMMVGLVGSQAIADLAEQLKAGITNDR